MFTTNADRLKNPEGVRSLHAEPPPAAKTAKAPDPFSWIALFILTFTVCPARAANIADPVLERPTLRCLGAYWILPNDIAGVTVEYRAATQNNWRKGPPLFRVERNKHLAEKYGSR